MTPQPSTEPRATPSQASLDATLYPQIEPYATGTIALDSVHTLHWEACGTRGGVPLVFIHGGPGGGSLPQHRRYYDPTVYDITLYDQRGCGRSTPAACLIDNTTPHLVADLERLRIARGVDRWVLFGGSWGSTLALAYAQAHPERVLGLILRGIFLGSEREIDWFVHRMGTFFPEAGRAFVEFLPSAERSTILESYYRRLTDPDSAVHRPAACAWDRYETACSMLRPQADTPVTFDDAAAALTIARIEAHYFMHRIFLREGALLAGVPRIRHLPCSIVQGRYDVVCPPVTADALARAWPGAEYVVVPDAGHSAREPGIARELVRAARRMQQCLA